MINIDISYLKKIKDLKLDQLVFLNLVYDESNKSQTAQPVISLVAGENIQDLINRNLVSVKTEGTNKLYEVTDHFKQLLGEVDDPFKEFYDLYPSIVQRPDGTRGYLRTNLNKCRIMYRKLVGKSAAMHRHLIECLQHEIDDKMSTNKMGYMKTMFKWLANHEWEVSEEQMKDDNEPKNESIYGTELV